jgi:hypothetical protein
MARSVSVSAAEHRAKYTQSQIDSMGRKGLAFGPDPAGHYSYPIGTGTAGLADLSNAIHAVGRGNAAHQKIRLYIIGRARALGALDRIPSTWDRKTGALK